MASTTRLLIRVTVSSGLFMLVSACGGSSDTTTPPTLTQTLQEDKLGTAFGNDFRASPNSEPANVSDGDTVAVSLTTEPIQIN